MAHSEPYEIQVRDQSEDRPGAWTDGSYGAVGARRGGDRIAGPRFRLDRARRRRTSRRGQTDLARADPLGQERGKAAYLERRLRCARIDRDQRTRCDANAERGCFR